MAGHAWLDSLSEDWPSQLISEESPSVKSDGLEAEPETKTNTTDNEHNDSTNSVNNDPKSSTSKPTGHDRIPVPLVDLQAAFHESGFALPFAESSGANSNRNSKSNSSASSNSHANDKRNSIRSAANHINANDHDVSLGSIQSDANSVVHNTVNISQASANVHTPEWKRRLLKGELGYGEQRDLFHSAVAEGLENIFKPPSTDTATESEIRQSIEFDDSRDPQSRHEMTLPSSPPVSNIRRPPISKEFEDTLASDYMDDSPSPSPRKLPVYRMNDDSQCFSDASALQRPETMPAKSKYLSPDSYLDPGRRSSNVSVAQNETFSPIIVSPLQGKDGQLEIEFTPISGPAFDMSQQPETLSLNPPASASHQDESNMFDSTHHDSFASSADQEEQRNENLGSTQRSAHHSNQSDGGSFRQGSMSPGIGMEDSELFPEESLQASTPKLYPSTINESQSELPTAEAVRERLRLDPVIGDNFQLESPQRSPLKLFGPYDTFTNQVLVRRISQLEHDMASPVHDTFPDSHKGNRAFENDSDNDVDDLNNGINHIGIDDSPSVGKNELPSTPLPHKSREVRESQNKRPMKINNFGRGDLEGFTFDETNMSPSGTPESAGKFQIPRISIDDLRVPRSRVRGHTRGRSSNDKTVGSFSPDSLVSTPHKDRSRDNSQEGKRPRPSPCKDPTPKRRRTLHKSDIAYGMDEILNQARSSHLLLKPGAAARKMLPPPVYRRAEKTPVTPPSPSPSQRKMPQKLRMFDREFQGEDDEADDEHEADKHENSEGHSGEGERQIEYSREHQEEHSGEHYQEHYHENYDQEYYDENHEHYDEQYDGQYDENHDGQYDEHYDEHAEEEEDGQYREQYDEHHDGQYDEHYDEQYDEHYDEHYNEQNDEHYDQHYDEEYEEHIEGDYEEAEDGQHFNEDEEDHQDEEAQEQQSQWPSGSPPHDNHDDQNSARFSRSPSPVGTPYRATSLQSNQISDRKPSIKTQDFLDEAGKIMALIRKQVRPGAVLDPVSENMPEPGKEVADDDSYQSSTREPFDRPPSRENAQAVARQFPQQQRDPEIEKRLRKYKESVNMNSASVSSAGRAQRAVKENKEDKEKAPELPQPSQSVSFLFNASHNKTNDTPEERKFRPALRKKENGRYTFVDMLADGSFSDSTEMQLARNPEPSANRVIFGGPRSGDEFASVGSRNSLSSRTSESKKTIAPESVVHLIPDQVGDMFLDREKKTWVKRKDSSSNANSSGSQRSQGSLASPTHSQAPALAQNQVSSNKSVQSQTQAHTSAPPLSALESKRTSMQRKASKASTFRAPPSTAEYGQSIMSQPPTEHTFNNMSPSDDSEDDPFASIPDLLVDEELERRNLQLGTRELKDEKTQQFVEGNSFKSNPLQAKASKGFVTFAPDTAVDMGMSPRAMKELNKLGSRHEGSSTDDTEKPVRSLFRTASAMVQALVRKPNSTPASVSVPAGNEHVQPVAEPKSPTEAKPLNNDKKELLMTPSRRVPPTRAADSPSSIPKPIVSSSVKKRNAISFSSPIASVIRDLSGGSEEDPRWNLPSAPSNTVTNGESPGGSASGRPALKPSLRKYISSNVPAAIRHSSVTRLSFVPRPVSRIDEEDSASCHNNKVGGLHHGNDVVNDVDEEGPDGNGDISGKVIMSIEKSRSNSSNDPDSPGNFDEQISDDEEFVDDDDMQLTILDNSLIEASPGHDAQLTTGSMGYVYGTPGGKGQHDGASDSAIIARHVGRMSLSPLSEFTIHAADESYALEVSYVVGNRHLQTGDGNKRALPITVRDLVERLTDAEPSVSFWDDLEELELNDNRLISLHMLDEFCGNLVKLDASGNALTHLEGVPSSLRQLKIVRNSITEMASWDHLVNLQYLDLSNNDLKSLSALRHLVHLRSIRVDNNHLTSLDGLGHHDAILSIRARGNNIRELDFNNCVFERLEELDVSQNKIERVANVDLLPVLSILKLQNNCLADFHIDSKVPSLRVLELSDNDLAMIDLRNLSGLRVLHADRNRIVEISSSHLARHLDSLSLREQRGPENLSLSFLSHAYEVRKLFLSGNHIPRFDPPVDCLNLQLLELANCGLRSLPRHLGQCMPNLRTININFNALEDLSPLLFIPRIKRLLAAGNRLRDATMVTQLLTEFPHMTRLDLRDNPMTLGFYPPAMHVLSLSHGETPDPFTLPNVDSARDRSFAARLDTLTRMRRRLYQMVLVGCCSRLKVLDGLEFKRSEVMGRDVISEELVREGIVPAEMVKWRLDDSVQEITENGEGTRRGRRGSSRWS
ncbi:hypothetical protein TD95_004819 [Thielaviopsis punctulata]|uniref:Septation initiation network scaffold protein cdc11 n=1 Tax=Thielaviopsis punctulata TaxID=72032 RepID=A0A0F4ZFR4_9PEZI|nr:hypothetical protein TD95_004819 [Thielaviopsis punctulata]